MTSALTADTSRKPTDGYVSVPEAASMLGRDRTRVYALIRSGDLDLHSRVTHGVP